MENERAEKLKAYKSLDAYNNFTSGWVTPASSMKLTEIFSVLKTAVKPSQSLSNPSHKAWVAVKKKDGSICTVAVIYQEVYTVPYLWHHMG